MLKNVQSRDYKYCIKIQGYIPSYAKTILKNREEGIFSFFQTRLFPEINSSAKDIQRFFMTGLNVASSPFCMPFLGPLMGALSASSDVKRVESVAKKLETYLKGLRAKKLLPTWPVQLILGGIPNEKDIGGPFGFWRGQAMNSDKRKEWVSVVRKFSGDGVAKVAGGLVSIVLLVSLKALGIFSSMHPLIWLGAIALQLGCLWHAFYQHNRVVQIAINLCVEGGTPEPLAREALSILKA